MSEVCVNDEGIQEPAPPKEKGGRPLLERESVKNFTLGVRLTAAEVVVLKEKAAKMGLKPGQWLREAALSRRLPPSPVPTINREQYAELARLAANLNQLTAAINRGHTLVDSSITVLLDALMLEVSWLRLALLGITDKPHDRQE